MVTVNPKTVYLYPPFQMKSRASFVVENKDRNECALVFFAGRKEFFGRPVRYDQESLILNPGRKSKITLSMEGGEIRIPEEEISFTVEVRYYLYDPWTISNRVWRDMSSKEMAEVCAGLRKTSFLVRVLSFGSVHEEDDREAPVGNVYSNSLPLTEVVVGDQLKTWFQKEDELRKKCVGAQRGRSRTKNPRGRDWTLAPPNWDNANGNLQTEKWDSLQTVAQKHFGREPELLTPKLPKALRMPFELQLFLCARECSEVLPPSSQNPGGRINEPPAPLIQNDPIWQPVRAMMLEDAYNSSIKKWDNSRHVSVEEALRTNVAQDGMWTFSSWSGYSLGGDAFGEISTGVRPGQLPPADAPPYPNIKGVKRRGGPTRPRNPSHFVRSGHGVGESAYHSEDTANERDFVPAQVPRRTLAQSSSESSLTSPCVASGNHFGDILPIEKTSSSSEYSGYIPSSSGSSSEDPLDLILAAVTRLAERGQVSH